MEQDFLESDIVFPEGSESSGAGAGAGNYQQLTFNTNGTNQKSNKIRKTSKKMIIKDSQIIEIPSRNCKFSVPVRNSGDQSAGEEDYKEMVPPHVVIGGRLITGKRMAYSVCAGKGRTLKGRDLRQFRDSILKMTGFLEGN